MSTLVLVLVSIIAVSIAAIAAIWVLQAYSVIPTVIPFPSIFGNDKAKTGDADKNTKSNATVKTPDVWSDWALGDCSKPCGTGTRTKTRSCLTPADGVSCKGETTTTENCNTNACVAGWGGWETTGACSSSCGPGTIKKKRTCLTPALGCAGDSEATEACNLAPCPIDGAWSDWKDATTCTKPCGGGEVTQSRTCTPPQNGGRPCADGPTTRTVACNPAPCPIDGVWSGWKDTTTCSQPCGGGQITQSRTCTAPQNGGKPCDGLNTRTIDCNTERCFSRMEINQNTLNIPIDLAEVILYDPTGNRISTVGMTVFTTTTYDNVDTYPGSNIFDQKEDTFLHTSSNAIQPQQVLIDFKKSIKIAFIDVVSRPGWGSVDGRATNLEIVLVTPSERKETLKLYRNMGNGLAKNRWRFALTPSGKYYWIILDDSTVPNTALESLGPDQINALRACEDDTRCYGVKKTPEGMFYSVGRGSPEGKFGHAYYLRSDDVNRVIGADLKSCTVPGTFSEDCLDVLWKSVGCKTNIKDAINTVPGKTWTSQLAWYNNNLSRDAIVGDMKQWAANASLGSEAGSIGKACKG